MHAVDWSTFGEAELIAFADAVARVARDLSRSVPAPRGAPLFGLDMAIADPYILDRFSRHGIFRKYQRAIALGSDFGGIARWWSVHFGCTVLSVDPHAGLIAAAERLGRPARLTARTTFRSAPLHNLPLRAEQFTHAWSIEALAAVADADAVLREAWRVLRPAGLLTAILPGSAVDTPEVLGWVARVAAAGFLGPIVKPLPAPELPYSVYYAEQVLRGALAATFDGGLRTRLLELAARLDSERAERTPRVMLFAERPS